MVCDLEYMKDHRFTHLLVGFGESIASEGKGSYMYVEGQLRSTDGTPIPDATIETWETDHLGKF